MPHFKSKLHARPENPKPVASKITTSNEQQDQDDWNWKPNQPAQQCVFDFAAAIFEISAHCPAAILDWFDFVDFAGSTIANRVPSFLE